MGAFQCCIESSKVLTHAVEALRSLDAVGTDSDAGEAWVEDMAGEPTGAVGDDDEPQVGGWQASPSCPEGVGWLRA